MKVVMKRGDVFSLWTALNSIKKEFGFKVAYAISKNKKAIKDEIEATDSTVKPSEAFEAYDKERMELGKRHAKKDPQGAPMTKRVPNPVGGGMSESFDIANMAAFDKEHEALKEKYKDAVEAQERKIKERNESLADEVEMEFHGINPALLDDPKMNFSVAEMDALAVFVDESMGSAPVSDIKSAAKKRT